MLNLTDYVVVAHRPDAQRRVVSIARLRVSKPIMPNAAMPNRAREIHSKKYPATRGAGEHQICVQAWPRWRDFEPSSHLFVL